MSTVQVNTNIEHFVYTQKKIGILGGMGPASTAEFLRILAHNAPAKYDQQHPVVYLISDPQIPDRSAAILGKGEDPTEKIRNDLFQLIHLGADMLAVPCNTAHYFIDRFLDDLPVPFIHIVQETILRSQNKSPHGCWLISSLGTRNSGLYQRYAQQYHYHLYIPEDSDAEEIHTTAEFVKAGLLDEAQELVMKIVRKLQRLHDIPFMVACTEFPLAYNAVGLPRDKMISCLDALSEACLRELYQ